MRGWAWVFVGLLVAASAAAQTVPRGADQVLAPPSLPPNLPGGLSSIPGVAAIPGLQGGAAPSEVLQRLLDAAGGRAASPAPAPVPAQPSVQAPAVLPVPGPAVARGDPGDPLSGSEAFFAARLPDQPPLRQFGYDTFRNLAPPGALPTAVAGMLPDDYVLGRDDEVAIAIRGRSRASFTLRVQRDGMLVMPDLPPFPAQGRTLAELRADIVARVARELGGSEAFVSIGQTRQIGIFVAGEVVRPGLAPLPALSSVLDALGAAGGVRKTGTLRAIRVEGPGGARVVDLYAVIAGSPGAPDLSLREGDRVIVPPLGGVVAIGGDVTRPGIYEMPARAASVPLAAMMDLAGGALRPQGNRYLSTGTDAGGRRAVAELSPASVVRRGDAVTVTPGNDVTAGGLRLVGHVTAPVTRAAGGRVGLRALLYDPRLIRPDPYVRMGVVWRAEERTRVRRFVGFDLGRVMTGGADLPLRESDEVILLSQADVLWLSSPPVQRALRGETAAPVPAAAGGATAVAVAAAPAADCPALLALAVAARSSPLRFAHARGAGFPDIGAPPCPQVFHDYPALLPFLLDQSVLLTGELRLPGLYPVLDDTGLDAAVAAAGGVTETADLASVEFAREPSEQAGAIPLSRIILDLRSRNFAAVRLSPRDAVRVPRGFGDRDTGPVMLVGEVARPGTYDIRRGERLSELLARAGGLTPQAYPYGAVFTRESVRVRQQEGFQRTARELESSLLQVAAGQAVAGSRAGGVDLAGAINAGQALAATLRESRAAGRMTVEANPVVLAARPELDVLLEPGDLIAIPKRPNEVTVVGSVLNPGSLQFTTGWRASQYVRAAGGPQRFADEGRAFVVLPNGQSVPAGLGSWQAGGPPVPPGSLVVVPQDPSPYETWGFIRDLTQVLGQVSISAASLAVIARSATGTR